MKSPDIDSIRNKVNLDVREPTPLRLLVLQDKPTPKEAQALLAWASIREKCAGYGHVWIAQLPLLPSESADFKERVRAGINDFIDKGLQGGNYLTALLYQRRITFGEFNRQRAELQAKLQAEEQEWAAVVAAADYASTLQKAAIAEKHADAAVAILQAAASAVCASATYRTVQKMC
jgi:hypothetical protein